MYKEADASTAAVTSTGTLVTPFHDSAILRYAYGQAYAIIIATDMTTPSYRAFLL